MNPPLGTAAGISRRTLLKGSATTAGTIGLLSLAGSDRALALQRDAPNTGGHLSTTNAALTTTQLLKLTASDTVTGDGFGSSVAISADETTALIGVPGADNRAGTAYVYDLTTTPPTETKLTTADPERSDSFGLAVAVSGDGNTAIIGSPGDDDFAYWSGSASVFDLTTNPPTETELRGSHDTPDNYFGEAVSISADGTTAIVGAARHMEEDIPSGAAHVYDLTSNPPRETILIPSDRADWDNFGHSVSVNADGTAALIGSWADSHSGISTPGSAYVYDLTTNPPTETKLTASDANASDYFGWAVSISGDATTALVGALRDQDAGSDSGSAYRYDLTTTPPTETKLTATDAKASDYFGESVALNEDGTAALIGASGTDDDGSSAGSAYRYDLTASPPAETKLTANDATAGDRFGTAVSINADGTTVLVGARYADRDGPTYQRYDTGAAYVFGVAGPFITELEITPNPANAGAPFDISATVADPTVGATIARADYEIRDTNDDVVTTGSMQAADGAFDEATEAIRATVRDLPAGSYDVCVTGTDSRDTEGPEVCVPLEVRESASGFVSGGGWLESPRGAYLPNPSATGKATFNVMAKTTPQSSIPRGHVMYRVKACKLAFKSRALSSLTVAGTQAHLSGTGTLNRTSGYRFTLTVTDGDLSSPHSPDHVHMRIWNPQNDLVYDNHANTELGHGNISLKTR